MGNNRIPVELIHIEKDVNLTLKKILDFDDSIIFYVDNITVGELTHTFGKSNKLRLRVLNTLGEEISISSCLFRGNHLMGVSVSLKNGESHPIPEFEHISQLRNTTFEGEIKLLDGKLMIMEKADIVKHLWDKFERKLDAREDDFSELEDEYMERIDNEREKYKIIIKDLQLKLREVTKDNVFQSLAYDEALTDFLMNTAMAKIREDKMISKDLYDELDKVIETFKNKTKTNEKREKKEE